MRSRAKVTVAGIEAMKFRHCGKHLFWYPERSFLTTI
jgi:hypothetical protein